MWCNLLLRASDRRLLTLIAAFVVCCSSVPGTPHPNSGVCPCLGRAGDELLPVSARAVIQNFPVASKGKVALDWLVLAVWVPCYIQANWGLAVYCSSHYLGLNLFLQIFCMVYTAKGLSTQSWEVAMCKQVSKHCWLCCGLEWVTRSAVNFSRCNGFSRSFRCIILLRGICGKMLQRYYIHLTKGKWASSALIEQVGISGFLRSLFYVSVTAPWMPWQWGSKIDLKHISHW